MGKNFNDRGGGKGEERERERETFRIFVGIFVIWLQIFLLFSSSLLPFSPVHFRSYVVFSN